ncbi:phage tail protein I [Grimontia sp. SpTr1]|uniref:phage tail protein I n=1 Tax=Grimontia sp. SpTr1 TaxID=2995319 RepID=UPI00248AA9DB|nr:phage tail protein I [Grimontia sp. SpTr1]
MSKSLLPPNASGEERALEQSLCRDIPVPNGQLWSPDTCPKDLLPWLAWSLSVEDWDAQWPEALQRETIKQAATIHRHKGTVGAVRRALAALGVSVDFLEWFQDTDDMALARVQSSTPHTFVFIAWANANPYTSDAVFLNPSLYASVRRAVESVKPVRAHFDFLVGARLDAALGIGLVIPSQRMVTKQRGDCQPVGWRPVSLRVSAAMHLNRRRFAVARYRLLSR